MILLHGFPGNEKNLDLAQTFRRAGYNVLFFNYRGSWGSPGQFSFTHCIEDVNSAIAFLRDPANAAKLRVDPAGLMITSDDWLAASNDAFTAALKKSGSTHTATLHLATDHVYSDYRIALETSILNWLATL